MTQKFTHLHVHTEYSLLDGYCPIEKLIHQVKSLGMTSIAITDHGVMYGVIQFYKTAIDLGIKPIIGCEIYITDHDYRIKDRSNSKLYHLILLAENNVGYSNLVKIVSEASVNGFYYKPRVDKNILRQYHEGIICLSACLGGDIPQAILNGNYEQAKEIALEYREIFGADNFYLELQDHNLKDQQLVNKFLLQIHHETGIPVVATNDVHYVYNEDASTHDVLLCVQTGKTIDEKDRMSFPNSEFFLKSPEQMTEIFKGYESAIENTEMIADRCNVNFDFNTIHLPEYRIPLQKSNFEFLKELVSSGLEERYDVLDDRILSRATRELEIINQMGYVDYFLIVWDFVNYAKEKKIPVGPGRGSAAGSIVSYALGITGIDPLKYDLIFERFLNPERISMPDIDIDFCYERREEVIEYVRAKYGDDKVAQIITFGTMAARNAIRDVGRAINIPYNKVDSIAKMIPNQLGITLKESLKVNSELEALYNTDATVKKIIDYAIDIEGMPRHASTHAAGVVISKKAVTDYVPLTRNGDSIVTQFTMMELEELGLLKMDFLGLRTLTVIEDSLNLIKDKTGTRPDLDAIDENDPKVMNLFNKAETIGIFQFESPGMRSFLKELKPTRFDDLIAANSLFRPGPMNEIPTYIRNRHNPAGITYLHPTLEPILNVSYGVIVYQEQVMQIVQKLGGFTLGEADLLRRAMGKKKMSVMEKERERFVYGDKDSDHGDSIHVPGCVRNGIDAATANKIYDLMIDFAKYAFNKSHSAAYSLVAIQTAWLKTYYPVEYFAALINSIMGQASKVALYSQEAAKYGINVLPPDVNKSYLKFSVEENNIRFGLMGIKNVGSNLIQCIINERIKNGEFKNFDDLIYRILAKESSVLNKKAIESLVKSGALDSIEPDRGALLAVCEEKISAVQNANRSNIAGQTSLFSTMFSTPDQPAQTIFSPQKPQEKFTPSELIRFEKDVLGIYVTGHPLKPYEMIIKEYANFSTLELDDISEGEVISKSVQFIGIVSRVKKKITKNNQQMAFIVVEDEYNTIECIVFPQCYEKSKSLIVEDAIITIKGTLTASDAEAPKVIVNTLASVDSKANGDGKRLYLQIEEYSPQIVRDITDIIKRYPGYNEVCVYIRQTKQLLQHNSLTVDAKNQTMLKELEKRFMPNNIRLV